jgi:damage-control phosphatase, subfamily I
MKMYFDCIPCIIRQALSVSRFVTDDQTMQETILRTMLEKASRMDLSMSPPHMGRELHKTVQRITGIADPYKELKDRFNQFALSLLPALREKVDQASDPFETAVRLSIAGNIIDFGAYENVETSQIIQAIEESITFPIDRQSIADLKREALEADKILFLGDNCGEIVFDQLLLTQLPLEKVTYAVRGGPTINDATMEDAVSTGLTKLVNVIDNGYDAPGTILEECSADFQEQFYQADVIIAKGQGNYETLSENRQNIFFLLKSKCPIAASHIGYDVGSIVIKQNKPQALQTL